MATRFSSPFLEEPFRDVLLAVLAAEVGAHLDPGQRLDRVVVEQVDEPQRRDPVVAPVQVLVEDVRGGIVADALAKPDHRHLGRLGRTVREVERHLNGRTLIPVSVSTAS